MATNVTKVSGKDERGLIVPDPRWVYGGFSSSSSLSQANPRPGVPVAQQITGMVLEASGEQAAGDKCTVTTQRGGMPGVEDARHVWSNANVAAGQVFGWEAGSAINQVEAIVVGDSGGGVGVTLGGCVTLNDGTILVGGQSVGVTAPGAWRRVASTGVWSLIALPSPPTGTVVVADTVCFFQLPQGRVHAYYAIKDSSLTGFEFYQVVHSWSDAGCVTWKDSKT